VDGRAAAVRFQLDGDTLSVALELADQALRGHELARSDYASLVSLMYEGVVQGLPYPMLLAFVRGKAGDLSHTRAPDAV